MRKTILITSALLLASCAEQQKADLNAAVDTALRQEIACGLRNVASVDDGLSDAQTVALALSLRCYAEYQQSTEALGKAMLDSYQQRDLFRERRNLPQSRIESFLPVVMRYRNH